MLRKLLKSKWLKFGVTIILIYLAFRRVDIDSIWQQLRGITLLPLTIWVLITVFSTILLAYRWSLLLIKKPKFSDVTTFSKSIWSAAFYGLFVPTSAAGDVFKWIIIDEKYPEIPKSKLAASILLDRFVGMTMLVFFGFVSQFFASSLGVEVPSYIRLVFLIVFTGCIVFYTLVFTGKADLLFKHKWLSKIKDISELVNKENSKQIIKGLGISIISDFFWVWQTWMISQYFGSNLSFVEILIFMPVIATILILPISIAGFGAREQLYLFFFTRSFNTPESILLTSALSGIMGILNSLLGGLISLSPEYRRKSK